MTNGPMTPASQIKQPIRICYVIDRLNVGGTETQLLTLIRHLDRSRVEPLLCLLDGEDPLSRELEPADCPVIRLGVRSLLRPRSFLKLLRLARYLRRQKVDVVQVQFADSTYFGIAAAIIARVPYIVRTRRDVGLWRTWKLRVFGRRLNGLFNRFFVDALIANSDACRQAVVEQERPAPRHIEILPNGLDLSRFEAATPPRTSRRTVVGIVCRLRPEKCVDQLIRAAQIVCRTIDDVEFRIGGDGPLSEQLQSLVRELALENKVTFAGSVTDVPGFLADLDIAVLCSKSEGSPNSVIEYMAAGKPVVATHVGGTRELFEHERQGLFVPASDVNALASAVLRLIRDRPLAAKLGAAARLRAEDFRIDAMLKRYESFYDRLVSNTFAAQSGRARSLNGNAGLAAN